MKQIVLTGFMFFMSQLALAQEVAPEVLAQGVNLQQHVLDLESEIHKNEKSAVAGTSMLLCGFIYATLFGTPPSGTSSGWFEFIGGVPTEGSSSQDYESNPHGAIGGLAGVIGMLVALEAMKDGVELNDQLEEAIRLRSQYFEQNGLILNEEGQVVQSPVK